MSQYKRCYYPGGCYFFTLVTYQRQPILIKTGNIKNLKNAINKVKLSYPFTLSALVILPDHLHLLLKLPDKDTDFSTRIRLIKRYFSINQNTYSNNRNEKYVWQRRFWEHLIYNEDDWKKHFDYIHYNPVKHGYVKNVSDWPFSSFHYWLTRGIYDIEWGSLEPTSLAAFKRE